VANIGVHGKPATLHLESLPIDRGRPTPPAGLGASAVCRPAALTAVTANRSTSAT
jgi:hypothetical protein